MKDRLLRLAMAVAVAIGTTAVLVPPAAAAARPDLRVTSLSKPPANLRRGRTFNITDVTKNVGTATAKASTTRYYLSRDNRRGGLADIRLAKVRKVRILGRGKAHKGTVKGVVVPKSIAASSYFLLACADDLKKVRESNERNNCRASTTKTSITAGPPVPNITGTTPTSPNNSSDSPLVFGNGVEASSTVRIFVGDCTGEPVASGTSTEFSAFGLQVSVPVSSSVPVAYVANATDNVGNVSACSTGDPQPYEYDVDPPLAPTSLATNPSAATAASPVNDNAPVVTGTAEEGADVSIYTDAACTVGDPLWTGVATGGTFSIPVVVTDDSSTTFYARATDHVENVGPCSTDSVTYNEDSAPPSDPVIDGGDTGPSTAQNPTWTFHADALETDAVFECALFDGSTAVAGFGFATCTSPKTYDLTGLGSIDKTFTFKVRTRDLAGNESLVTATATYHLDRFAASPIITPAQPALTNDDMPDFAISGIESGATDVSCTVTGGTLPGTPADCSGGSFHPNLTAQADGVYTISVTQTDARNNTSAPREHVLTLDRAAPDAPTIGTMPANMTKDPTPGWTFGGESGATFECALYAGASPVGAGFDFSACTSPHEFDLNLVADGTYTFRVRQTDAAGNLGPDVTDGFTLDRQAPSAPSGLGTSPGSPANNNDPSVTGSAETGSTVRLFTNAACTTEVGSPVTAAAGTFSIPVSVANDSTTTFFAHTTDAADNTSPCSSGFTYVEDSAPPEAPTDLGVTPASPSNVNSPVVGGSAEAGSVVRLFTDNTCATQNGSADVADGGTFGIAASVAGNTTTTFHARATDAAGNQSPCSTASVTYVEDSLAPTAPSGLSVAPVSPANHNSPTVGGSAEAGSSVRLFTNATCSVPIGSATTAVGGAFSIGVSVADNTQTNLHAQATDPAGNVSSCSAGVTYVEDSTAPVAPAGLVSDPASPAAVTQPTIKGTVGSEASATVNLFVGTGCSGVAAGSGTTAGDGSFAIPSTVVVPQDSAATFFARATDRAGNVGPCSATGYLYEHLLFEGIDANDDTATADGLGESPTTAAGALSVTDTMDFWAVFVPEGASLKVATFDQDNGATCSSENDTILTLYGPDGVERGSDDNDGAQGRCSLIDGTADAPRDSFAANLVTAGGNGATYFIKVSDGVTALLPIDYRLVAEVDGDVVESEPNNTSGTADGNITGDALIQGAISTATDRDFFKLNLSAPRVVRFDSFDPDGNCPDGMQTILSWFHPNSLNGTESNRLRSEDGRSLSNAGGINQCASMTMLVPAGISYLQTEEAGRDASIAAYVIQVDMLDIGVAESEANDGFRTANPIALDGETSAAGSFQDGDQDWYSLEIPTTSSIRLETIEGGTDNRAGGTDPNCESGVVQTTITLFDTDGTTPLVTDGTGGRTGCSVIDGTGGASARDSAASNLAAGTYYVRVMSDHGSAPQPSFDYRLVVNLR